MKNITKQKWIRALRSGKYRQATGQLESNGAYCCLGVLCKITGNSKNRDMEQGFPRQNNYTDALDFMGIDSSEIEKLAWFNDDGGKSFNEIADWIASNIITDD